MLRAAAVFVFAAAVGAAAPSVATSVAVAATPLTFGGKLTAADQADIARIEQYLNNIKTMQSRFIQTGHDGRQASGTFSLSRPGKMRLTYDPPIKDFVVADGLFIFYWDGEMQQQSSAPVGSSLADVILRKDVKLSGEVEVKEVVRLPGALEMTLAEAGDPGKGTITLIFQDKPLSLIRWRIRDAQGLNTEVGLLDPKFGVSLNADMFYFRAPAANDASRFGRR